MDNLFAFLSYFLSSVATHLYNYKTHKSQNINKIVLKNPVDRNNYIQMTRGLLKRLNCFLSGFQETAPREM